MPAISVIVVNWNGRHLLPACLDSLRAQSFRDFECIVVDNGSSDGSGDWIEQRYREVRLVRLANNHGFAGGNNAGIDVARGDGIVLLNNDAEADPTWLEELNSTLRQRRDYSFFASQVVLADHPERLDSAGDGMSVVGAAFKIGHRRPASRYHLPAEVFGASGAACCLRRSLLEQVGQFDERFFCIYEDADLSFRARLRGHRCLYCPAARVRHRVNATLGRRSAGSVFLGQRNLELVYHKNMPEPLRAKYRASRRAFLLVSALYFAARGHAGVFWRAKRAARLMLADLPRDPAPAADLEALERLLERRWLVSRVAGK